MRAVLPSSPGGVPPRRAGQHRRRLFAAVAALALVAAMQTFGAVSAWASAPAPINLESSSCPTNISQGEVDGCVTELQNLLNTHGASVTVDGNFGSGTLSAVKTFQGRQGLSADGVVGPLTKQSLYAKATPTGVSLTSSSCPTDISRGEIDGCVTTLQQLLNGHGASLTVDGNFGAGTLAAVRSYQASHGLASDGIVGPNTKASLTGGASSGPAPITLTSSSCPTDIIQGEVDGCVSELQTLLNSHGASIAVDGNFGPGTLAAVKTFQAGHGLSVDGIVGPLTKAALAAEGSAVPAPIAITSSSCPTDMTRGEVDGCVTQLQQLLNSHGASIAVDGNFGPATFAAVENYQSAHGLSVDGIVGPNTKSLLTGSVTTPPVVNPPSGDVLAKVVSYAQAVQNGAAEPGWGGGKIQYVWGGGHHGVPGPSTGTCVGDPQSLSCSNPSAVGLDCSGFARWVYDLAYGRDVLGAGGTGNQISEMTRTANPAPGDLVFFGASTSSTEHVGVYIGNGQMINAYATGTVVETDPVSRGGNLLGYYQYGSVATTGRSTNIDWAKWVLTDGNWPQSANNVTVLTQWMSSEQSNTSQWWTGGNPDSSHVNPLNNGLGSGGGAGLGNYPDLLTAAHYVAENLTGGSSYATVRADLAASAAPSTTAAAIWNSPWASSHYGYGSSWHTATVAAVAAPASLW